MDETETLRRTRTPRANSSNDGEGRNKGKGGRGRGEGRGRGRGEGRGKGKGKGRASSTPSEPQPEPESEPIIDQIAESEVQEILNSVGPETDDDEDNLIPQDSPERTSVSPARNMMTNDLPMSPIKTQSKGSISSALTTTLTTHITSGSIPRDTSVDRTNYKDFLADAGVDSTTDLISLKKITKPLTVTMEYHEDVIKLHDELTSKLLEEIAHEKSKRIEAEIKIKQFEKSTKKLIKEKKKLLNGIGGEGQNVSSSNLLENNHNKSMSSMGSLVNQGRGLNVSNLESGTVTKEHLTYLTSVDMFKRLTPDQLQVLLKSTSIVEFGRGEDIIKQGKPGDAFFIIISGRVDIHRVPDSYSPLGGTLKQLGPGGSFGERALMLDEPRFATCTAAHLGGGRTRCLRIERIAFDQALSNVQDLLGDDVGSDIRFAATESSIAGLEAYADGYTMLLSQAHSSSEFSSGGDLNIGGGGRLSESGVRKSLEEADIDAVLSDEERTAVMLLLFDAFAPELNLDDSLALLLTITKKILNVGQVRLYWPVDVEAKRLWVRAVDGAIKNTPVKWGSSAALLSTYAHEADRQLHWDGTDPDQAAIAKETNANVDLRTGMPSKGVLATAILTSRDGQFPGDSDDEEESDSDSDSDSDESDEDVLALKAEKKERRKEKAAKAAAITEEEKRKKSAVCGVLELVNSKRGIRKFTKKDFQIAELVANEVASLMAHRAREVAFLDPTHGLEAALGAFAIEGSGHHRRDSAMMRSRANLGEGAKDPTASVHSGYMPLYKVVDTVFGGDAAANKESAGFALLSIPKLTFKPYLYPLPEKPKLKGGSGGGGGGGGGHDDHHDGDVEGEMGDGMGGGGSNHYSFANALNAYRAAVASRKWCQSESSGKAWCVARVTLLHGRDPLAAPWCSDAIPLKKLHDPHSQILKNEKDDKTTTFEVNFADFNAERAEWAIRSRDLPRGTRVLIEAIAVAKPKTTKPVPGSQEAINAEAEQRELSMTSKGRKKAEKMKNKEIKGKRKMVAHGTTVAWATFPLFGHDNALRYGHSTEISLLVGSGSDDLSDDIGDIHNAPKLSAQAAKLVTQELPMLLASSAMRAPMVVGHDRQFIAQLAFGVTAGDSQVLYTDYDEANAVPLTMAERDAAAQWRQKQSEQDKVAKPGLSKFKALSKKVMMVNKFSFIAMKAKNEEADKAAEEEAVRVAEEQEQDSKRRHTSIKEVLLDGLENWETKMEMIPEAVMKLVREHGLLQILSEDDKELLWRHRELLLKDPTRGLSVLAMTVDWTNREAVLEMYRLLQKCPRLEPFAALFLLDAKFPDPKLRAFAVRSLDTLSDFTLSELMLQLVQVLKFEPSHDSCLGRFLLRRAVQNPPIVGHSLYWTMFTEKNVQDHHRHCRVLLELFLRKCGESYRKEIGKQQYIIRELSEICKKMERVNSATSRDLLLREELTKLVLPRRFQLPLSPYMNCSGIEIAKCKVMKSKKRPLWLTFENADPNGKPHVVLYKTGDDLRQDALTLQVLRVMEGLWVHAGIDLKMCAYGCVSTGFGEGMLEVVPSSNTIAGIVTAYTQRGRRSSTASSSRRKSSDGEAEEEEEPKGPRLSVGARFSAASEAYFGRSALTHWLHQRALSWVDLTDEEKEWRRLSSLKASRERAMHVGSADLNSESAIAKRLSKSLSASIGNVNSPTHSQMAKRKSKAVDTFASCFATPDSQEATGALDIHHVKDHDRKRSARSQSRGRAISSLSRTYVKEDDEEDDEEDFAGDDEFDDDTRASIVIKPDDEFTELTDALDNFRDSCAGSCVATYILGLGDRHNDNIMLTEDGRLFHIDFGHFLGNFKSKFGVKREAAPFVFTRHFEAALGGRKDGIRYRQFQGLCVKSFLILRRHANLLLTLFSLMVGCGIPELRTFADLDWMYDALMVGKTEEEASKKFLKLIHLSLQCKTTRVNHALHIIAKG